MTDGERRLWSLLRRKQLGGFRFRRQAAIGPYIADFFCPKAKLIVEVDGEPHSEDARIRHDEIRTRWLEAHGCKVVRFWNIDVFRRPDEVTDVVARMCADQISLPSVASRHLPPRGGKEKAD